MKSDIVSQSQHFLLSSFLALWEEGRCNRGCWRGTTAAFRLPLKLPILPLLTVPVYLLLNLLVNLEEEKIIGFCQIFIYI